MKHLFSSQAKAAEVKTEAEQFEGEEGEPLTALAVEAGLEEQGAASARELEQELSRGQHAIRVMAATFKGFLQKVEVAWAKMGAGDHSLRSQWSLDSDAAIGEAMVDVEGDVLSAILADSKNDPLFEEYMKEMLQQTVEEWEYGGEEGDPAEDLKDFAAWHVGRKLLPNPDSVAVDPFGLYLQDVEMAQWHAEASAPGQGPAQPVQMVGKETGGDEVLAKDPAPPKDPAAFGEDAEMAETEVHPVAPPQDVEMAPTLPDSEVVAEKSQAAEASAPAEQVATEVAEKSQAVAEAPAPPAEEAAAEAVAGKPQAEASAAPAGQAAAEAVAAVAEKPQAVAEAPAPPAEQAAAEATEAVAEKPQAEAPAPPAEQVATEVAEKSQAAVAEASAAPAEQVAEVAEKSQAAEASAASAEQAAAEAQQAAEAEAQAAEAFAKELAGGSGSSSSESQGEGEESEEGSASDECVGLALSDTDEVAVDSKGSHAKAKGKAKGRAKAAPKSSASAKGKAKAQAQAKKRGRKPKAKATPKAKAEVSEAFGPRRQDHCLSAEAQGRGNGVSCRQNAGSSHRPLFLVPVCGLA